MGVVSRRPVWERFVEDIIDALGIIAYGLRRLDSPSNLPIISLVIANETLRVLKTLRVCFILTGFDGEKYASRTAQGEPTTD